MIKNLACMQYIVYLLFQPYNQVLINNFFYYYSFDFRVCIAVCLNDYSTQLYS